MFQNPCTHPPTHPLNSLLLLSTRLPPPQEEDRAHSSSEGMLATWARSLGAAWRSLGGPASAKPPTGREVKDAQVSLRVGGSGGG